MQKDEIVKRLKEFFSSRKDVKFAYLFGSVATGETHPLSDIDVAVMCKGECDTIGLASKIGAITETEEVDVVDLAKLERMRMLKSIIKEGIVLKSSYDMAEWEVNRYHKALDFIAHTKSVYGY